MVSFASCPLCAAVSYITILIRTYMLLSYPRTRIQHTHRPYIAVPYVRRARHQSFNPQLWNFFSTVIKTVRLQCTNGHDILYYIILYCRLCPTYMCVCVCARACVHYAIISVRPFAKSRARAYIVYTCARRYMLYYVV